MKKVTSVTIWNDSTGRRLSITYSEIDEKAKKVIKDNVRETFVIFDDKDIADTEKTLQIAQLYLDNDTE